MLRGREVGAICGRERVVCLERGSVEVDGGAGGMNG